MPERIAIERMTVLPDRIEAELRIADERYRYVTPELAAEIRKRFPTVPFHTCRNAHGPTFEAVMDTTTLPHLFEHLVIDIQTHEHAAGTDPVQDSERALFTGTTQWSAEDPDVAIVRVSFLDDLIALGAFKKALNFINQVSV